MSVLFDFFVVAVVMLATGAALFLLLDPTLDTSAADRNNAEVAASHSRRVRLALSMIVAAVFSVLEYATHRVLLSTQLDANTQAMCDGAVNAFAGAVITWALLSAKPRERRASAEADAVSSDAAVSSAS
jgi:hypothetical protein